MLKGLLVPVAMLTLATGLWAATTACDTARKLEGEQKAATDNENAHIESTRKVKDESTKLENERKLETAARDQLKKDNEDLALKKADKAKTEKAKTEADQAVTQAEQAKTQADQAVTEAEQAVNNAPASSAGGDETGANTAAAQARLAEARTKAQEAATKVTEAKQKQTEAKEKDDKAKEAQDAADTKQKESQKKFEEQVRKVEEQRKTLETASKDETARAETRKKSTSDLADSFRKNGSQAYRCKDFKVTPLALALTHTKYTTFKQVKEAMLKRIKDDPQQQMFAGAKTPTDKAGTKAELERLLGKEGVGGQLTTRDRLVGNLGKLMEGYSRDRQKVVDNLKPVDPWKDPVKPITDADARKAVNTTPKDPWSNVKPLPASRASGVPADAVWNANTGFWEKGSVKWDANGNIKLPPGPTITA